MPELNQDKKSFSSVKDKKTISSGLSDSYFFPEGVIKKPSIPSSTPLTEIFLARKIEEILVEYEPRVKLVSVNVNAQPDNNRYGVVVEFYVINHPEPIIIDTFLERLR